MCCTACAEKRCCSFGLATATKSPSAKSGTSTAGLQRRMSTNSAWLARCITVVLNRCRPSLLPEGRNVRYGHVFILPSSCRCVWLSGIVLEIWTQFGTLMERHEAHGNAGGRRFSSCRRKPQGCAEGSARFCRRQGHPLHREVHLVLGAGKVDGAMDTANLLKPILDRGEQRCIGATTLDKCRKHVMFPMIPMIVLRLSVCIDLGCSQQRRRIRLLRDTSIK